MAIDQEMLMPEKSFINEGFEKQYIISPLKFLMLNALSCGFYSVWWNYKVWRFLIQRKHSNANAAIRVVFEIVYFIPRCYQILKLAKDKGYSKTYFPILLFLLYFAFALTGMMPPPFFLLSPLSGVFLLQPLMAFNFILSQSPELEVVADQRLSITEIIIIVIGSIVWLLIIIGVLSMMFLQGETGFTP